MEKKNLTPLERVQADLLDIKHTLRKHDYILKFIMALITGGIVINCI